MSSAFALDKKRHHALVKKRTVTVCAFRHCGGECLVWPLALCCGLTLQVPKLPSQERLRMWQEAPTFVSSGSSKAQAEEAARLLLSRLVGEVVRPIFLAVFMRLGHVPGLLPRVWRRCGACSQPPEVSAWAVVLFRRSLVSPSTRTETPQYLHYRLP